MLRKRARLVSFILAREGDSKARLRLGGRGMFDSQLGPSHLERLSQNGLPATFDETRQLSVGVDWLVVNGTLVLDGGKHTGALPGKVVCGQELHR
jgi:hypothetical protein